MNRQMRSMHRRRAKSLKSYWLSALRAVRQETSAAHREVCPTFLGRLTEERGT